MIIAAMHYQDPDAAVAWLVAAFGLTEHSVYRDDDGHVGHAELSYGDGMVMVGGSRDAGGPTLDPRTSPVSVYVVVDDPRAHLERAKAAGAEIVRDLEHMDYGSDEYSARDPEGNLWSFGTYKP